MIIDASPLQKIIGYVKTEGRMFLSNNYQYS